MAREYVELRIVSDQSLQEHLIGILSQLGIEGFWEDGPELKCYISNQRWSEELLQEIQSTAAMIARSSSSNAPRISYSRIADQNWNASWEATIKPIKVSDRFVIKPTWHQYQPAPDEIVLTIDPKMSFGTGYHETTRLTLKLIEKHCKRDMTVLDVGTGTGVLAIATAKLGAQMVIGVDNDEWAFANARENVALNSVEKQVQILHGELSVVPDRQFDLIVANIQRNVLLDILDGMQRRLVPGGLLLLSGLLIPDREPMLKAMDDRGFTMIEELSEGDWIALASRSSLPPA